MADLVSEDLKEREEGLISKASSPMRKLVADLNCSLYSCRRMMPLEDWGDCEQSDTSSLRPNLSWLACDSSKGHSAGGEMTFGRFRYRFYRRLTGIAESCSRLTRNFRPAPQDSVSQRMCPFCKLITPRSGRRCLECGKSFGTA